MLPDEEEQHELPEIPKEKPKRRKKSKAGLSKSSLTDSRPPTRRPSIYDDLPVSMAAKINYDDPDEGELGGIFGEGGDEPSVSASPPLLPPASPTDSKRLGPPRSPSSPADGDEKDPGPIQKLFKPFFLKFWPPPDPPPGEPGGEPRRRSSQTNPKKRPLQKETIYGKVLEEVDPFVFEDVSFHFHCH